MNALKNSVQLIGNLGKDVELKTFENGNTVINFPLATNESYVNADGEKVENTQWHSVVAWGKKAETMANLLSKGTQVIVQGKLVYKSYDAKDGSKRYVTEVMANNFYKLSTDA